MKLLDLQRCYSLFSNLLDALRLYIHLSLHSDFLYAWDQTGNLIMLRNTMEEHGEMDGSLWWPVLLYLLRLQSRRCIKRKVALGGVTTYCF
jgi:hypothetical protein